MLQQVEKKSSQVPVSETIERLNEKGIKVNGEWWNFSKFSKNNPILHEGDLIELKSSKDYEILGSCLKDAVYITDDIHEVKFSTTDIVKLALTLFIHRTT